MDVIYLRVNSLQTTTIFGNEKKSTLIASVARRRRLSVSSSTAQTCAQRESATAYTWVRALALRARARRCSSSRTITVLTVFPSTRRRGQSVATHGDQSLELDQQRSPAAGEFV